jgi:MraZ protein
VFRGHYRHTIDTKGRLSIPSRFRDVLASGWGDKLVIVPNGKGLDVHPLPWWEELETKVDALPKLDPDARLFRYKYLSQGQEVELDPHGRIQVSADYRTRVGLVKDVVILGMQKMFEVWDAERWAHFDSESGGGTALDDVRARLADKGV